MARLPTVRRVSLADTPEGSLASVRVPGSALFLGLRVWIPGQAQGQPRQPGFVALLPKGGGGLEAELVMARAPGHPHVNSGTLVVNQGIGWSIHVPAKEWVPDFQMDFALQHSGLLLASVANQGSGLRLAVAVRYVGACQLLHFDDWTLKPMESGQELSYAAAEKWMLTLPGAGAEAESVF
jgi:hypothetical protein